jgi:hypothetical protein
MSTTTTIRLPGDLIEVIRHAVKGELGADCDALRSWGEDIAQAEMDRYLERINLHRALLDQIGWESEASEVEVVADAAYLKSVIESAMHTVSGSIAQAVGEYRREQPIEPEQTMGLVKHLEFLIEAWATVERNLEEELAVA